MKKIKIIICIIVLSFLLFGCSNLLKHQEKTRINRLPKIGDGQIVTQRLRHTPNDSNFIVRKDKNTVRIAFKAAANDVGKADIKIFGKIRPIENVILNNNNEIFYVDIETTKKQFSYYFVLHERGKKYYFGSSDNFSKEKCIPFNYNEEKLDTKAVINTWAKNQIFYYLNLDRFRNGYKKNDMLKNVTPWTKNYNAPLNKEEGKDSHFKYNRFYGGDFQGVLEKIKYLSDLKINAVVLSPVFYSKSVHKFDTLDYRHISPELGFTTDSSKNFVMKYKVLDKIIKKKDKKDPITNKFKYKYVKKFKTVTKKFKFTLSKNNKFGKINLTKKDTNELKKLKIDPKTFKNGYKESLDKKSWGWTESDLIFSKTVSELHKSGIRVILGIDIAYFSNDAALFKAALKNGPSYKYSSWFCFNDWEKVDKFSSSNEDVWNPYVSYDGNAEYGVKIINQKKSRRKWIKISNDMSPDQKKEISNWNFTHVDYTKCSANKNLIKLNYKNKTLQEYVINSTLKWVVGADGEISSIGSDDGVDGYSIDFPYEIDPQFLTKWIHAIKKYKKDFYFVEGTVNKNNPNVLIYSRDYEFGKNIFDFVLNKKIDSNLLRKRFDLEELMEPDIFTYSNINVISSNYTDRIYSMLINKEREYLEEKENYKAMNPASYLQNDLKDLQILIAAGLFYPGNFEMYYGDEIGAWGGFGVNGAKPMLWQDLKKYFENETDKLEGYQNQNGGHKNAIKFYDEKRVNIDLVNNLVDYPVEPNEDIKKWYENILDIYSKNKDVFNNSKILLLNTENSNVFAYNIYNQKEDMIVILNRSGECNLKISLRSKEGTYDDLLDKDNFYEVKNGLLEIDMKNNIAILKRKF